MNFKLGPKAGQTPPGLLCLRLGERQSTCFGRFLGRNCRTQLSSHFHFPHIDREILNVVLINDELSRITSQNHLSFPTE